MERKKPDQNKEKSFIEGVPGEKIGWIQQDDIKKAVTMNLYARLFQEFKKKVEAEERGRSASDVINEFLKGYCGH